MKFSKLDNSISELIIDYNFCDTTLVQPVSGWEKLPCEKPDLSYNRTASSIDGAVFYGCYLK